MKELNIENLTVEQKLGLVNIAYIGEDTANKKYILDLIKKRSLGGIWVVPTMDNATEIIAEMKSAADYPLLVFTDAENGINGYFIGKHNSLGLCDSEKLAYTFGKVTAITARKMGYNVVCNPILDMADGNYTCGGNVRSIGCDKYRVAAIASAEAKGMHDGGVLTLGKHYPGTCELQKEIDTHMAEAISEQTAEELLDYNLYPYRMLIKEGLLDGIMTAHCRYINIDSFYPASLSKSVINIIRNEGFDGISITDALVMMGIVARFGKIDGIGLSIGKGNDLALPFYPDHKIAHEGMLDCYKRGIISDERLNEAVNRIIDAQRKILSLPTNEEITDSDLLDIELINKNSIYSYTDKGVSTAIKKDDRHYFVILTESRINLNQLETLNVDTFTKKWYNPMLIVDKIKNIFPHSEFGFLSEYPTPTEMMNILNNSIGFNEVVFITYFDSRANIGTECFTSRVISLMKALQQTNRITTVIHFGNPYVLEDIPHIPRVIIGTTETKSLGYALDVLSGELNPCGKPTYQINLR